MAIKEEFLKLVSNEKTSTLGKVKERIKNRAMLRESQKIAIKVLIKLDELGWSQKDLAIKLEVSPQQVNKIVKGQENLTLETQVKLQSLLQIPILASFYDENFKESETNNILTFERKHGEYYPVANHNVFPQYRSAGKLIKMHSKYSKEYSYEEVV